MGLLEVSLVHRSMPPWYSSLPDDNEDDDDDAMNFVKKNIGFSSRNLQAMEKTDRSIKKSEFLKDMTHFWINFLCED